MLGGSAPTMNTSKSCLGTPGVRGRGDGQEKTWHWDLEAAIRGSGLTWNQLESPKTEMTIGLLSTPYAPEHSSFFKDPFNRTNPPPKSDLILWPGGGACLHVGCSTVIHK